MTNSARPGPDLLPALEAWRGLAALLVMMSHAAPGLGLGESLWAGGFMGVDLFFVLSGFVFAPYLLGHTPVLRAAFWIRRVFRIWPAFALAVLLYALLSLAQNDSPGPWLQTLFFLHLSDRETAFALNPAFWSLVPEVEFYALLPLIVILITQVAKNPILGLLGLTLGALILRLSLGFIADRSGADLWFILLHHLPGMLVEFLLGALAFSAHNWLATSRPGMRRLLALAGLVSALAAALSFQTLGDAGLDPTLGVAGISLWAALSAALLIAGTADWQPRQAPVRHLFEWMGHLSFGTYLFHHGALQVLPAALAIPATLGFAAVVFLLWERPMRSLGRRWAQRLEPLH